MNKIFTQKDGYVLVYVILTIILATILAASLYNAVFLTNRLFMQLQYGKQAHYNAVTGVEYGRYIIKSGHYASDLENLLSNPPHTTSWPSPPPLNLLNGSATILIQRLGETPPYTYSISSTGTFSGTIPPITKTVTAGCSDIGNITSWQ